MRKIIVKHILILAFAEAILGILYKYYKPDCCFPVADCTSLEQDMVLRLILFMLLVALLYFLVDFAIIKRRKKA